MFSQTGLITSGGMMVNYMYDFQLLDERADLFNNAPEQFHKAEWIEKLIFAH
jgi:hypothetical protein